MFRKVIALSAAVLLSLVLSTCAKNISAGDSSSDVSASGSSDVTGKVVKIDGSVITIDVGTLNMPSGNQNDPAARGPSDASPPVAPSGSPEENRKGQAPSGAASSEPSDTPNGGAGAPFENSQFTGGAPGFKTTGETTTITVTSSTVITIEKSGDQTAGSAADIAVGNIIKVSMTDTVATTVTVLDNTAGVPNGNPPGGFERDPDNSDSSSNE